MKKFGISLISALLALSTVSVPVHAKNALTSENIDVSIENDKVSIGNEYITREFSTIGDKLSTSKIVNNRMSNVEFIPQAGSEEFKIRTTKQKSEPIELESIDDTNWQVTADSFETTGDPGEPENLIDEDVNTYWHSNYGGGQGKTEYPYEVTFTLDKVEEFQSFSYTPRQNGEDTNGNILGYELQIATVNGEEEPVWESVSKGDFEYDGVNPIYVNLDKPVSANRVKFIALTAKNGQEFAGGAEFNLHKEKAPVISKNDREFAASDLTLKENGIHAEDTTAVINGVNKVGKKLTFEFEPFNFKNVDYSINEVFVMYEGDHFMRKFLEISVPNDQKDNAVIDYIDLESMKVSSSDQQWTVPTGKGGVVSLNEYKANLGQPIYIQGMFFGCEFPVTDTQIVDGTGYMRYYSGKSFAQLEKDNQLTADQDAAKYVTWQTVAGAARSTEQSVIQTDFFEYIDSISEPSEFRLQYNSWFDNMMRIDDENILNSFSEVDREFNKTELRPMDSFVVDDGWNNYNKDYVLDAVRSGTTLNKTGFWEFNSKFPNGLTPSSELVQNFGSNFGLWVGPRGGYNFFGSLADILTESGKGSKAGGSVDVADRVYVENLKNMFVDFQKKYGVNYWKWDGFADDAQFGQWPATDGVPGYDHNHMTGGYQHMYHVTDFWEAWIDLFEAVRASEDADGINNLWISLTCYVNPSPWFLQWANSVWMQCTGDRGESGSIEGKMDKMLTYRDAMYYDFISEHEFQFPLKAVYNHDPIYGSEGTGLNINSMTDEEFKNYLYIQAGRGTAFWELYYSDSLMTDGKYEANAEFLKWAEENFHILQHAKMIGGNPAEGVKLNSNPSAVGNGGDAYAFSAWEGNEGIISMRNSDTSAKTLTFTLDRNIGLSEQLEGKTLYRTSVHTFKTDNDSDYETVSYGDEISVTLQPGEVRIWQFNTEKDSEKPVIEKFYTDGDKELTVRFSEKVTGDDLKVNGADVKEIKKSVDSETYHIILSEIPKNNTKITVSANGISDLNGNKSNSKASLNYFRDNKVFEKTPYKTMTVSEDNSLNTNTSFTVTADVQTNEKNVIIAKQENGYIFGIDENGKPYFELNGARVTGDTVVTDNKEHKVAGVKENNGILKIYVDGNVENANYQEKNHLYVVNKGETTLAGKDKGIMYVSLYDRGLGYDEIADLSSDDTNKPMDTSKFTVEVSGTSEGNESQIFDDNPTTFWTSQEVDKVEKGNPYLIVDMGDTYKINQVDYTKRFADQADAYWKCTGNIREYVLEVSNDKETWNVVSEGKTFDDESYTEAKDGGTTKITFNPIEARYIRISATSTYHWQQQNLNKFITVGDLDIYQEEKTVVVDKSKLEETVKHASELDQNKYTEATWKNFEKALNEAIEVLSEVNTTQEQVNTANDALNQAINQLKEKPVVIDKSELKDLLDKYKGLNKKDYTEASWKVFDEAYKNAKEVYKDKNSTQQDVDKAINALQAAKSQLKPIEEENSVDKTNLIALIELCESLDEKDYTKLSWDGLEKALDKAREVVKKENSSQKEIDNAFNDLMAAKEKLQKAIAPPVEDTSSEESGSNNTDSGNKVSDNIETGVNTNIMVYLSVIALSGIAGVYLLRRKKASSGKNN